MLPAIRHRRAALNVEDRSRRTYAMRTTPVANVHHAILSMCYAVSRRLVALNIEGWSRRKCVLRTTLVIHPVFSMLLAKRQLLVALDLAGRSLHAGDM